jgi:hypothetical protein
MTKKRRKDDAHDIGDSKPGDVGDSKGTLHDKGDTPMARIHNRRDGELLSRQETKAFLAEETEEDSPGHSSDEERKEGYSHGSDNPEEVNRDLADKWEEKFDERHLPNSERYEDRDT